MLRVRVVKTASGSSAVQIIYYQNRKRKIFKHIGSGSTDDEIHSLKLAAQDFINNYSPTLPLLEDSKSDNLLLLNKSEFLGVYYAFFHEVVSVLISKIGFNKSFAPLSYWILILDYNTDVRAIINSLPNGLI